SPGRRTGLVVRGRRPTEGSSIFLRHPCVECRRYRLCRPLENRPDSLLASTDQPASCQGRTVSEHSPPDGAEATVECRYQRIKIPANDCKPHETEVSHAGSTARCKPVIGALFDFLKARKELKRFRSIPRPERQIVFYSEGPGYWSHFEPIYSALQKAGQRVLYVTSRHDDPVYQDPPPGIQAFNLGSGVVCTLFFATLDVDVLVMTMPDLNTFHIKRSPYGVHYAYLHHSIVRTHMVYRPGAFDHFDSVFCVGPHHVREIRKREEQEQLPPKILLEHGYGRLDGMLRDDDARPSHEARSILVAPSWGENSLLNLCATELIDNLLDAGHHVILRPHPRSRQLIPKLLEGIQRRYKQRSAFALDEDMDAHATLASAGVMISDWSGAALEFAFAYRRPVLFIDVPRKV